MSNPQEDSCIFEDSRMPWAIDMDGTLIKEDVTEIVFHKSLVYPWYWPLFLWSFLLWLFASPEAGFRFLERYIPIRRSEVTPNTQLLSLLTAHKQRGGKAVLATASHVHAGKTVVQQNDVLLSHLFDNVWGSCMREDAKRDVLDLSAETKARVLEQSLASTEAPGRGFVYAGNSLDDLKVWSHPACKGMILVNCDEQVLEQAQSISKPLLIVPR